MTTRDYFQIERFYSNYLNYKEFVLHRQDADRCSSRAIAILSVMYGRLG